LGEVNLLDMEKIVPDSSQNIYQGGIAPLGKYKNALIFWQIEAICDKYGVNVKTPIRDIPEEAMDEILNGTDERLQIKNESLGNSNYFLTYEGVSKYILMQQESEASASAQKWAGQFIKMSACPECNGQRLNKEALHYKIAGKNIADISGLDISELSEWVDSLHRQALFQATTDCYRDFERDPFTPQLHAGCGIGLPVHEPGIRFAVGRREPAYPSGNPDRESACKRTLYPRRAQYRTTSAR
jgi:Excinuclease ABC subunit A